MEAAQPRALYRASTTVPASKRIESRNTSPHAGFSASTVTEGAGNSPTFRGFRKCSSSASLCTVSTLAYAVLVGRGLFVVAGLIERDGQVLICQRQAGDSHEFKWEFPGGKVERGEHPRDALARELKEELGIDAVIGPELVRYEFRYAKRLPILLIFFRVRSFTGDPASLEFTQIRWEPRQNLASYDFLDGDTDFVRRLVRGEY